MSDKSNKSFPLCDLCGDYHEMLVGEKEDECPEAWAVEHLKRYESMYLKWVESEQKLQAAEEENRILREVIRKMSLRSDVGYSTLESNLIDEIKGVQSWNN